jgi:hypothetical protein
MKRVLVLAMALLVSTAAYAAGKTYQVTGPVLELRPDAIVVENKDKEKWEIARDANTKVSGELKQGAKVTIKYTMTATDVEVKDAKAPAKK